MFKQFVKNRVKEIRDKMPPENIGDTARARTYPLGASVEFLKQSSKWWNGPEWLVERRKNWPSYKKTIDPPDGYWEEVKTS